MTERHWKMITELDEMMVERLNAFRAKNKVLPTRIIVYRDGVSEVSSHHMWPNFWLMASH